ncbi:4-amino-4-deoxy-L-arabinose transferase [Ensifer adhaerens]|nr:4-amino-4-deoxy-L-arabinose transferase [Ensifer adhaerens]
MNEKNRLQMSLDWLIRSLTGVVVFLAVYTICWTIIPYFSNAGLPVDTIEEVAWSREWLLGIYRHPPMMIWIVGIFWRAMGGWIGSPYVASGVALSAGLILIYLLLRISRPASQAGLVVLTTPLVYFFGPQLPQWNANIAQLPFVGLFLYSAFRGVMTRSLGWTVLAGVAAGGGLLGKYSFGLIVLFAAAGLLADPVARSRVKILHVLLALLASIIVFLPHVWWFFTAPVNTVDYFRMSAERTEGTALGHLLSPLLVFLGAVGVLIPTILIVVRGLDRTGDLRHVDSAVDRSLKVYLGFVVIGPIAISAFIGALGGGLIKDQWLIAYLLPAPALVVMLLVPRGVEVSWRKSAAVFYLVALAILAIAYPAEREAHYLRADGRPVLWAPLMPAEPMAQAAQALWKSAVAKAGRPDMPIRIVAGGPEAAGVANVTPGRPAWFEHFNQGYSPWIKDDMIRSQGILAIDGPPAGFAETHGLCVAAQENFDWRNGRGGQGRNATLTVLLPEALCRPAQ